MYGTILEESLSIASKFIENSNVPAIEDGTAQIVEQPTVIGQSIQIKQDVEQHTEVQQSTEVVEERKIAKLPKVTKSNFVSQRDDFL